MLRAFSPRPSPAMVVAVAALFVALGGTGYAAVKLNGKNLKNRTVAAKKVKRNTLTGAEIRESTLGAVPNSARLAGQGPDAFLSSGGTAANSREVGGLPASSFVRRACNQNTGQIKGMAAVNSSPTFPGTFTTVSGYNCSGESVEARRLSMGRYEVRFNDSPITRAVATAMVSDFSSDAVSVTNSAPGVFIVYVLNPSPSPGAFEDDAFTLIAP